MSPTKLDPSAPLEPNANVEQKLEKNIWPVSFFLLAKKTNGQRTSKIKSVTKKTEKSKNFHLLHWKEMVILVCLPWLPLL